MFQLGCHNRVCFQNEILSGLTVALALVPEAVAFAFVATTFAASSSTARKSIATKTQATLALGLALIAFACILFLSHLQFDQLP